MDQPIFYFDRLKPYDKWTIGLYIVLTLGLSYYLGTTEEIENKRQVIFGYALLAQLFLYLFCYKSLRNLTVFSIWLIIGLVHLYWHNILKGDETLKMFRGHSATPLKNTAWLLLLFQVFRFLSAKIQGQELVAPSRGATTDLFDERRVNWIDFSFFLIYVACAIIFDL